MLRSVKSQIIFATSLIIIAILGATAYLVIDQKTKEINQDIYTKAVSFAELTHEQIIDNYEENYQQSAFAHFDREMADIYSLNQDITGVAIYTYSGEVLYQAEEAREVDAEKLERIQAIYPSVQTTEGRIVYLEKIGEGADWHYIDQDGREVEPITDTEQIETVVYPFRDQSNITRNYSVCYRVTYDALLQRVRETAMRIIVIAGIGVLVALLIGYFVANGITSPIKTLTQGAVKIGSGDLSTRIPIRSKSEVGMLANTFNKMASDLEESTKAKIEHEKVAKELELAAKIQNELLPKQLPAIENLDIAASLNAATEVGGDCYDFIPVPKDGSMLFYIADVTGHGVGAGLVSAINNALVTSLVNHYDNTKDIVNELNKVLTMKTAPNIFVTCCMALWNTAKGVLQFTQAGHDPIMHFQAATGTVAELAHGGLAMGMVPEITEKLSIQEVQAQPNDVFVFYTDGIPEAWQSETESYGMERLRAAVQTHSGLATAQEIHDALLADVRTYMGDYPQADDITLIVIKRTK